MRLTCNICDQLERFHLMFVQKFILQDIFNYHFAQELGVLKKLKGKSYTKVDFFNSAIPKHLKIKIRSKTCKK